MVVTLSKNNLYEKSANSFSYYSSSGTEANMRNEFINTLTGRYPEIAKAQTGLLRKMRLDSSGNKTQCPCVDTITKEPDKDRFCGFCMGEGYIWDETELQYYKTIQGSETPNALQDKLTPMGLINIPLVVFYIRYDADITKDDKIIQLKLELDGSVKTPIERDVLYRVENIWDYRADNGKLEYYKIFAHREDTKYLNAPSYGEL